LKPLDSTAGLARLLDFPASTLGALADSLEHGPLQHGITEGLLRAHVGSAAGDIHNAFRPLLHDGCTNAALAAFCRTLFLARKQVETAEKSVTLALSGPPVSGTPVIDTPTVVRSLFTEARSEVLIASYVFHSATDLLAPLAARHDADASFRVRIIVDLSHQRESPNEPLPVVEQRFVKRFLSNHWTGNRAPELWHDPRFSSHNTMGPSGVMHAKLVIIDRSAALVTSANFTTAAQNHNIEVGLQLRLPHQIQRLYHYFEGLIKTGQLKSLPT
jgi:phosphatidylserine/phosphatidylglycerophosphate/cardiolipin synthase-like enzyme